MAKEPFDLVVRGESKAVAYACAGCGAIFGADIEGAQALARQHCSVECACGQPLPRGFARCFKCVAEERAARDAKLFREAEKVPIDDYPDLPLYWEGHDGSMGTGFFGSVDELCDYCDEERETLGGVMPAYVWACTPRPLSIPADAVVQAAVEEHSGVDGFGDDAVAELQALLDAWSARQKVQTWYPDFTRAVLLSSA